MEGESISKSMSVVSEEYVESGDGERCKEMGLYHVSFIKTASELSG